MVDVRATLVDGKYNDTDYSEDRVKIGRVLRSRRRAAREPVAERSCGRKWSWTPQEFLGDVIGDLSRRRAV